MNNHEINPFDILSGKVVQNNWGTFWFKEAGNNVADNGWPIHDKIHRDNDLPAIIWSNGGKEWYKDGKQHRDNDSPAVIEHNGSLHWYKDGGLHRDNDLPANLVKWHSRMV